MLPHNPYQLILDELNELNDVDDEGTLRRVLNTTQQYVIKLRQGFRKSPADVDYSCPHQRAAYLLAYYPHYIEAVYRALDGFIPKEITETIFQSEKLHACFLGSGPSPEVLGWLAYINNFHKNATRALAYLVDFQEWYTGQILTTYHLAPKYWDGTLRTLRIAFDLGSSVEDLPSVLKRSVSASSLIVMQNCLNEYASQSDEFLANYRKIIDTAEPNTLFLIIDLKYDRVVRIMRVIEAIARECSCEILFAAENGARTFSSVITIPDIITEELLIQRNHLFPRKRTSFYLTAFIKPAAVTLP